MTAAVFAAVFVALLIGHSVGDQWVQTHHQACAKGGPGWSARLACGRHVLTLTATKVLVLAVVVSVLDLRVTTLGLIVGLGLDAASHYWADRRTTLARFAKAIEKSEYYNLGGAAHPDHPVTADGRPALTTGTGAFHLDQSFHHFWLGVAALLIAAF
ncbi:transcriptional regulator [Streptomyces sp. NBC_01433]|uniref:transcriptional regulator n=1 Tax=Streptomyces sp. NBC_01433 TaxID=2903864 RepID=UPI002259F3B5|nr:transcriptional regulator [Streptomyces sp. NBC_01433]MCX4682649.1 transcriptional regulator [Streptomyces sp. NBC_01433]MCX4682689.1 transcriptional regulator [Streptomyces sp. NBC_01433]